MRIQHNIAAMNSYRNFSANGSKLNKNLEKLSTGYKINRAGDDAAGLAISEKMRVQISGLEAATKNAKDGISLVQTAEGALTEVHDMLNRMVTLTEQSANGTYDDSLDRNQLQKEVSALQTEIDRIADSTNYNGIKLLDGSLAGSVKGSATSSNVALKVEGFKDYVKNGTAEEMVSSVTVSTTVANSSASNVGDKMNITVDLTDGTSKSFDLRLTGTSQIQLKGADGEYHKLIDDKGADVTVTSGTIKATDIANLASKLLQLDSDFTEKYDVYGKAADMTAAVTTAGGQTVTAADGTLQLIGTEKNFDTPGIKSLTVSKQDGTRATALGDTTQSTAGIASDTQTGKGEYKYVDMGAMTTYDTTNDARKVRDSVITVDGQKFGFAKDVAAAKELGSDVNVVFTTNANPNTTDVASMVKLMNQKLGANIATPTGTAPGANTSQTQVDMISRRGYDQAGGAGGLTLQIGDTSDKFNQLNVSIEDMHSASIGVGSVDISTQQGAAEAIDKIKSAVNFVSNTRGTLGALQNRLDHTINNLGVMRENIQSAESLIRDTDVAEEMMTYTKNNILNQSAQAMLAQANQLPQGVLQLLG